MTRPCLAVLLPQPGGFLVFARPRPGARLLPWAVPVSLGTVSQWLASSRPVGTIVLVGNAHAERVADAVLDHADLLVVPIFWLRHLPRADTFARAGLAGRIAASHLAAPLRRTHSPRQLHVDPPA